MRRITNCRKRMLSVAVIALVIAFLALSTAPVDAKSSSKPSTSSKSYASRSSSSVSKPSAFSRFNSNKVSQTPKAAATSKPSKYCHMKDGSCVGSSKPFTATQKAKIIRENMRQNKGRVRDDVSGRYLAKPQRLKKGVKPSPNEYQVDHKTPRKPSNAAVAPGTNSYSNAQVISRDANRKKSNKTNP